MLIYLTIIKCNQTHIGPGSKMGVSLNTVTLKQKASEHFFFFLQCLKIMLEESGLLGKYRP